MKSILTVLVALILAVSAQAAVGGGGVGGNQGGVGDGAVADEVSFDGDPEILSGITGANVQNIIDAILNYLANLTYPSLADIAEINADEALRSSDPRANANRVHATTATTDFALVDTIGDNLGSAIVVCNPSGGDAAHVVTLPDPTTATTKVRTIMHGGGVGTLTVDLDTDVVLDEIGESVVVMTNGTIWIALPRLNQTTRYETLEYAISDETTALTTGTAKITVRMPFAMTLTAVRASLSTVSSSGTPTFDINEGGATVLSTKLTIDANEKTSTTAVTAAVISDSALADDAEITIDIDTAGTGAAGAKIKLFGTRTL